MICLIHRQHAERPRDRADAAGIPAISRWSSEATPPDRRPTPARIPEGCKPTPASIQIPLFISHTRRLQKLHHLLAERLHAMMFGLVRDVFLNLWPDRRAHRESSVALLPGKLAQSNLFMHPDRRSLLQLSHEIGKAMRRLQSHQQMHMITYAANTLSETTQSSHGATKVFVESISPCNVDERRSVLRGEHDVIMQSEERRWHNDAGLLASLRDARLWRIVSGGVASLNHRLMAGMPSAS